MNEEDRRYLKSIRKVRLNLEVFENMVKILKKVQEKTDRLLSDSLLRASNNISK